MLYAQETGTGRPPRLMLLDRESSKWKDTGAALAALLLAADGDDLVYWLNTRYENRLIWIRMRDQWNKSTPN